MMVTKSKAPVFVAAILSGLFFAASALAQDSVVNQEVRNIRGEIRDIRTERREAVKSEVEKARTEVKNIRATATTSGGTRNDVRTQIKDVRTETRQNVKDIRSDARDEIKAKQETLRRARLNREVEKIYKRFMAAVERLRKLADRIESRIMKFEEQGRDMASSKAKLTEARTKIDKARIDTEAILGTGVSQTSTTTGIDTALQNLRGAVNTAKESVKTAHAALVDVVNGMKPGRTGTPATTTGSTN